MILITDASPYGIGAQLCNRTETGKLKTVACISAILSETEIRYTHYEKEALSVIIAVKKYHKYLYGRHFEIHIDSLEVKLIFEEKALPSTAHSRLLRWTLFLSGTDYHIHYAKHVQVADCLSRLQDKECTDDSTQSLDYVLNLNETSPILEKFKNEIRTETLLCQIKNWALRGWPKTLPKQLQSKEYQAYCKNKELFTTKTTVYFSAKDD